MLACGFSFIKSLHFPEDGPRGKQSLHRKDLCKDLQRVTYGRIQSTIATFDKKHFRIYNTAMVNKKQKDLHQDDVEITTEDTEINDPDVEEIEEQNNSFNNSLRDKLKVCETEKREILEESQRTKADFLNARKRLEEERRKDRERSTIEHIEELIPLCDSFQVAMANKEVWEKADLTWRKGIEGIHAQLQNILSSNNVSKIDPTGAAFDPYIHEALSTIPVTDKSAHEQIVSVIQMGYELKKADGTMELIRPARVVIGDYTEN